MAAKRSVLAVYCFTCLFHLHNPLTGQDLRDMAVEGSIYGRIVDLETGAPVEFATVALYDLRENKLVKGTSSNKEGEFSFKNLSIGLYDLEIRFIGYKKTIINRIIIKPSAKDVFLGKIELERSVTELDEVEVVGKPDEVMYKADRKIINIENNLLSKGGTIVDALEQQPAVQTDMNGNMTLRGSPNFTVLINGKPTALKGSDALQQIPANNVKRVEIITVPSARFDPEGDVGIINVITKTDFTEGISGFVNAGTGVNTDLKPTYSSESSVQYTNNNWTVSAGLNTNARNLNGTANRFRDTFFESGSLLRDSDMDVEISRKAHNFNSGIKYSYGTRGFITLDLNLGKQDFERSFNSFIESSNDSTPYLISDSKVNRNNQFLSSSLSYEYLFNLEGHKLSGNLFYSSLRKDSESNLLEQVSDSIWAPVSNLVEQYSEENGNNTEWRLNLDYEQKFKDIDSKLEAGFQSRIENTDVDLNIFNSTVSDVMTSSGTFSVSRNIEAGYFLFTKDVRKFSIQAGIRPEYTRRNISFTGNTQTLSYFRLFPSFNTTYGISETAQIRLAYSKRINRPLTQQLNPFISFIDEKNLRQGNINLEPEFIHSLELGMVKYIPFSFFSAELFYRQTQNKLAPVWIPQDEDLLLLTYENLNRDHSFGLEALGSMQVNDWWRIMLSTSIYRYNINGQVTGEEVNNSSNSWNLRVGSNFDITKTNTEIQFKLLFNSSIAQSQGSRSGFFVTMLGISQPVWKDKLEATLQFRDLFSTMQFKSVSESEFFYTEMNFEPRTPIIALNLSFRFNDYKKKRKLNDDVNQINFEEEFVY